MCVTVARQCRTYTDFPSHVLNIRVLAHLDARMWLFNERERIISDGVCQRSSPLPGKRGENSKMKIGILSDVHANEAGLKNALRLFQFKNVDKILCAGDLVDKGDQPNEVVKQVRELKIPTVLGNHDDMPFDPQMLNDDTRVFLSELPTSISFRVEQREIYVTHGTPWSKWEYVFPESDKQLFKKVIDLARADVVILGHTHMPMTVRVNEGQHWIVNPGTANEMCSYGAPTCGILTLKQYVSFHVYDLDTWQPIVHDQINVKF